MCAQETRHSLGTVCIDAGHGGNDPGCNRKIKGKFYKEKEYTLSIAKSLEKKIKAEYPGVKVVMTRTKDVYVGLPQRCKIANEAKADLFISIHIDASSKSGPSGFSVHCLGPSSNPNRDIYGENMDVCRRENSAYSPDDDDSPIKFDKDDPAGKMIFGLAQMVHLEQSLAFAEEIQKEMRGGPIKKDFGIWQKPYYVLAGTSMPAVLIECGFISNTQDLNVFESKDGKEKIAENIFKAFKTYKTNFDRDLAAVEGSIDSLDTSAAVAPDTTVLYGAQIMAIGRQLQQDDKAFKGLKVISVFTGNIYKYIAGSDADIEKARENLKKIKKTFPDAFLVKVDGNSVNRVK